LQIEIGSSVPRRCSTQITRVSRVFVSAPKLSTYLVLSRQVEEVVDNFETIESSSPWSWQIQCVSYISSGRSRPSYRRRSTTPRTSSLISNNPRVSCRLQRGSGRGRCAKKGSCTAGWLAGWMSSKPPRPCIARRENARGAAGCPVNTKDSRPPASWIPLRPHSFRMARPTLPQTLGNAESSVHGTPATFPSRICRPFVALTLTACPKPPQASGSNPQQWKR
jgi:hypothetical protein